MKIEIIKCLKDNYSYLIIDEKNKNACVVDPGESAPIIDFFKNNNTHTHVFLRIRKNIKLLLHHLPSLFRKV